MGGHTASIYRATWKNYKLDYTNELLCDVKGFINLYGVSNLSTMHKYCSALEHDKDRVVPFEQSIEL